ncbi:hypothetical protein [Sorangium sp. So ce854]|uniref:hypothetical protein n=1 Tax=Sorangium sp. So ce854 TaxID=3133322 RepID=UPI003F61E320
MLDGLGEIDWSDLEHAYGPADDVPGDLRGLLAEKAGERNKAWNRLVNNLNHQDTPEPAATEAVPFLIELAGAPSVQDRARILVLLADLATGGDHGGYLTDGYVLMPPDPDDPLDELHERVAEGRGVLVALLEDRAAAVRAAAALVLGFLPERAEETAPAVRARLAKEKDGAARASGLLALGLLDRALRSDEDRPLFERELSAAPSGSLPAFAAAAALAWTTKPLPGAARDALLAVIRTPPKAAGFPWHHGDLRTFAVRVLGGAARADGDLALLRLLLDAAEGGARRNIAAGLISTTFAGRGRDADGYPRPGTDLDEAGREVLKLLYERNLFDMVADVLRDHGFAPSSPERERSTGVVAPGPLDRAIEGAPAWLRIRRLLDGRAPEAAWLDDVKRALSCEDAIALVRDAGAGTYHLYEPWPPVQLRQHVAHEHEGRLASLLVRTLEAACDVKAVTAYADELRAAPERPQRERAVAVIALARLLPPGAIVDERFDRLITSAMDDPYHQDGRAIVAMLPLERRERLILPWPLVSYMDGDRSVPTMGWHHVDLAPTPAVVEKVIEAVQSSPYGPPPADHAIRALAAAGPSIAPRLRELAAAGGPRAEIFAKALAEIEARLAR